MPDPLAEAWLQLAAFWRQWSSDPADEQQALAHAAWLADDERRRKERGRRYRRRRGHSASDGDEE